MVEWIVLQTLMHLRQQREYDRLQQDRHWKELHQPAAHSVRVGIMGLGELGIASAKSLMSLGFQLNSWSRSEKSIAGITSYFGDNQLHAFLGNTDILISLLPYTQSTHGILNRQLFEKLARNGALNAPVVINAGRGGSQVETDIVTCLQDGTLGGVSLDVFETEPLAPSSPLWVFENAILTPHVAAISDPNALAQYVAGQILSYEDGKPLDNLVDKKRGY